MRLSVCVVFVSERLTEGVKGLIIKQVQLQIA